MLELIEPLSRSHPTRRTALQSTRERLVQVGLQKVLESGWAATGLDAVLRECGVPKGSFYHYFASKEVFGYALLAHYQGLFVLRLDKWFVQLPVGSLVEMQAALNGFLDEVVAQLQADDYRRGCLVGALGQEVASLHAGFRAELLGCLETWEKTLSNALFNSTNSYQKRSILQIEKIEATSLFQSQCDDWARDFWVAWEGAVLHCLIARNPDALYAVVRRFGHQIEAWAELEQVRRPGVVRAELASKSKLPRKIKETQAQLIF